MGQDQPENSVGAVLVSASAAGRTRGATSGITGKPRDRGGEVGVAAVVVVDADELDAAEVALA